MKSETNYYLFNPKAKRVSQWLMNKSTVEFIKYGWVCLHLDDPKESLISELFLKKYSKKFNFIREYEIFCQDDGDLDFNKLLIRYFGDDVIIPFSLKERVKRYPCAFKELDRYMKKYLSNKTTFMWDSNSI